MKLTSLFLIALLVFLRFSSIRPKFKEGDIVKITTRVTSQPINLGYSQRIYLLGLSVYLPSYPEVHYQDKVAITGRVKDKTLTDAKLISVEESSSILPQIRKRLLDFYKRSIPESHAGLVAGITLGAKSTLTREWYEKIKNVGVSHVVVASGTNITLVSSFLISMSASFLSRRKAILLSMTGILGYLFLAGLEAPLVRAAIMGGLAFTAQEFGRLVSPLRVLFITAAVMLFVKPEWLTDVGFLLSFASTLAIILFQKKLEKGMNTKLKLFPRFLKKDLSTSIAAQIGVTPILYVVFRDINILSPVVNSLVLWTVSLIMIVSGFSGLVGLVYEPLGRILLFLVYPLTGWFLGIVDIFSNVT